MINRAICWKTAQDSMALIVVCAWGIVGFGILFVWAMLDMGTELMAFVSKFSFLKKIFEFGFGIDVSGDVSLDILLAVCFTHAIVFMLSGAVVIAITTRTTAGEIERGTADLLLALPVHRGEVYFSTSLVWWLASVILAMCPILGIFFGLQLFETEETVALSGYLKPAVNFFFLLLAIGGISSLASSLINRRGPAIGVVVGFVMASFVLNFVEPFIEALKPVRFLGLLNYFRPVDVVRSGQWPIFEIIVLLVLATCCWTIGGLVFCRKDIPTA